MRARLLIPPFGMLLVSVGSLLIAFALFLVSPTCAQQPNKTVRPELTYNHNTEIAVEGIIEEVRQDQMGSGLAATRLIVRSGERRFIVHLGVLKVSFFPNEAMEITGSEAQVGGSSFLLARRVRRGNQVFTIRNERGIARPSRALVRVPRLH